MSEEVYQQPLLLRVRFEGNFLRLPKNICRFSNITATFNSLPERPPTSTKRYRDPAELAARVRLLCAFAWDSNRLQSSGGFPFFSMRRNVRYASEALSYARLVPSSLTQA